MCLSCFFFFDQRAFPVKEHQMTEKNPSRDSCMYQSPSHFPSSDQNTSIVEKESIGFENPPRPNKRQSPSEGVNMKKGDYCFVCRKEGHWAKYCPTKSPNKTPPPRPAPSNGYSSTVHCGCGLPLDEQLSNSTKNPNRLYYSCPRLSGKDCKFFFWSKEIPCDKFIITPTCGCGAGPCRIYKETSGQDVGCSFFVCPIKKGQGACSFVLAVDSVNPSDDFLDDPLLDAAFDLLEDQGVDATNNIWDGSPSSAPSTLTSSDTSRDMAEGGNSSDQGMEIESTAVDTPDNSQKARTIFVLSMRERVSMVDSHGQEDMPDEEPLRRHCKRLRHGDPKVDSPVIESTDCWETPQSQSTSLTTENALRTYIRLRHGDPKVNSPVIESTDCWETPQSKSSSLTMENALRPSILTSEALIRQRQVKFLRQISSAGSFLVGASSISSSSALTNNRELLADYCFDSSPINEILCFNFKGWCGRLVFPPSRSLTLPAPKPFFCGVFPCFDPIPLPQDTSMPFEICSSSLVESGKQSLPAPFEQSVALLNEASGLRPPHFQGDIIKQYVLDTFKQAAASLQEKLLIVLESTDFHDHASMLEESCYLFSALEKLAVDYKPFKEMVMEYIGSAEALAQVEMSMDNENQSSRELFDYYNRKKLQLEAISDGHAQTLSELEASNIHVRYLEQEASRLKDMFLHIEEKLACCKVDNMEIDARFNQIAEDKLQLELNLQAAFNEAEEAKRVCQQREAEQSFMKASFDKARSELRQSCNMLFLT